MSATVETLIVPHTSVRLSAKSIDTSDPSPKKDFSKLEESSKTVPSAVDSTNGEEDKRQATCSLCSSLFTDARTLPCEHNFCFQCLTKREKREENECPNGCPNSSFASVDELIPNAELNRKVGELIRQGICAGEHVKKQEKSLKAENHDPVAYDHGVLFRHLSRTDDKEEEMEVWETHARRHAGRQCFITCNHCHQSDFTGSRFKCGMCDDFDLCEGCAAMPRDQVHDVTHVFVELKRQRNRHLDYQSGPCLEKGAAMMGESYDFKTKSHGLSGHTVKCSNCGIQAIEGTRYKCGMCEDYNLCESCEKKSEDMHDKDHVFLVLPHPCREEPEAGRLCKVDFY